MKKNPKEERKDHIVATFGRFNPPTVGHLKLIDHIKKLAKHHGADHIVFASASQDKNKNPLSHHEKVKFMKQMFPDTNIQKESNVKNMLDMMKHLHKQGYKKATIVVGGDRLQEINNLLHKYNGKEYDFDHISVVSAGHRDPDSDGDEGISASKMRDYATKNNFKEFRKGVPQKQHAKELFNAVRKRMKVENHNCLFLVGGPGSGKDFLIRTLFLEAKIHEINLDKLHKAIMDKKDISEINEGISLIVNGNADDEQKVFLTKQVLEAVGYKTAMVYVFTSDDVSKERNDVRIQSGARTFNESIRQEKYSKSINNLHKFEQGFDGFAIFNNSYDLQKINEEKKEEVLGWMEELQSLLESFFSSNKSSKEKSLDEEVQELLEDRESEFSAHMGLSRTHRINIVKQHVKGNDYFAYNANKANKTTTNAAKKPIEVPLKPNITRPTAHLAREEVKPKSFRDFKTNHKHTIAAKPPIVQSDIRAGDGMSATATLAAEGIKKSLSEIKENILPKSPDGEYSTPEIYEDWGVEGLQGIYEGRSITVNKPFKTTKGYAVYVKDGDNVKCLNFNKGKRITLQEKLSTNDVRFWESL